MRAERSTARESRRVRRARLGSVSEVSRKCLGSVSEVSRKCLGSVSEVHQRRDAYVGPASTSSVLHLMNSFLGPNEFAHYALHERRLAPRHKDRQAGQRVGDPRLVDARAVEPERGRPPLLRLSLGPISGHLRRGRVAAATLPPPPRSASPSCRAPPTLAPRGRASCERGRRRTRPNCTAACAPRGRRLPRCRGPRRGPLASAGRTGWRGSWPRRAAAALRGRADLDSS